MAAAVAAMDLGTRTRSPWVPFYAGDFLAGTAAMTDEETGVYIRLLAHQAEMGSLPAERIHLLARRAPDDPVLLAVLRKFERQEDGTLVNRKMAKVSGERERIRSARITAGSKGGSKSPSKTGSKRTSKPPSKPPSKTEANEQATTTTSSTVSSDSLDTVPARARAVAELKKRIEQMFGLKAGDPWTAAAEYALLPHLELKADVWDTCEIWLAVEEDENDQRDPARFRKQSPTTFLENLGDEVAKARRFAKTHRRRWERAKRVVQARSGGGAPADAPPSPTPAPEGWEAVMAELFPNAEATRWEAVPPRCRAEILSAISRRNGSPEKIEGGCSDE